MRTVTEREDSTRKVLYTAMVMAAGGREGYVRSQDGILNLSLSRPKEFGGFSPPATNPEYLFAAGFAVSFGSSLPRAAWDRKIAVKDSSVTASVGMSD